MNFRNGDRCTGKHVFGPVLAVAGRNRETAAFLCGPLAEKPALNFLASATHLARRAAPSKTAAFLIIIYNSFLEFPNLDLGESSQDKSISATDSSQSI